MDLACGHGRHAIELAKKDFDVDGLDFSDYLLKLAKEYAKRGKFANKFLQTKYS